MNVLLTFKLADILPLLPELSPVGKVWYWDRKSRNRWLFKTKSKFKSTTTGEDPSDQDNEVTIPVRVFFFTWRSNVICSRLEVTTVLISARVADCDVSPPTEQSAGPSSSPVWREAGMLSMQNTSFLVCRQFYWKHWRFSNPSRPPGEKKQSNSEVWAMQGPLCMGPQKLN